MTAAYGFAAQTPNDVEGYVAFYNLKKLWQDFRASKAGTALFATPWVQQKLNDPSLLSAIDAAQLQLGVQQVLPPLKDLFGAENFVIFCPGSSQRVQAFQQFSNELRLVDMELAVGRALHSGKEGDSMAAYLAIYKKAADSLQIPPLIFGGKVATEKAGLLQQLELLEKKLPAGVEVAAFNLNGNQPFKSLGFIVSKLLPAANQEELKQALAGKISDPKQADEVFQSLMARRIEVAYGFVGDYFLVSVGNDHAHLKLAANFGDSLLARPELAAAGPFAEKPILSLSWFNKPFMALSLPHYKLASLHARLKPFLDSNFPEIDSKKLAADLARIDTKAAAVFPNEVDPSVGIVYRDRGICSETYGGIKMHGFSSVAPLKFSGIPSDSTFVWLDAQCDPAVQAATWDWIEDLVRTGYDWFQTVGLPRLPTEQKMGFALAQNLAVPKLIELYHISREEFSKSLGNEGAFALDLGGDMPQLPMVPQAILQNGKMPRLAFIRDVRDRKLLTQSWGDYFKIARDVALMIPQTAGIPGGLPGPKTETQEGITLSYYPLPLATGDLLPNIATTDRTLVMSSSQKYSIELSKAAAKSSGSKPLILDLRIQSKAACDFLDHWILVALANPDLIFAGKPQKAAAFKQNQPALSRLIQSARSVTGLEGQLFEENGLRRTTLRIGWKE